MYCVSCEVRTEFIYVMYKKVDHLCHLVVRVPGYRSRGPGFDSRRYKIFCELVGLERGSFSFVSTTEELLHRKSCRKHGRRNPSRWPRDTLYQQKMVLTSPTSGGRSVGIVGSRTQATVFSLVILRCIRRRDKYMPEWNKKVFSLSSGQNIRKHSVSYL
jgi:hypothetical protein